MSKNFIDYGSLVDNAMHIIVKQSLQIFANLENPGEHHFFVSFVTNYPGVIISDKLKNKYPYEMTIILQYMFNNLTINDDSFSVTLSFDNRPETLVIPFAALTAFADPSVKFGLQFRYSENSPEDGKKISTTVITNTKTPAKTTKSNDDNNSDSSNVITLDFRNKKRL